MAKDFVMNFRNASYNAFGTIDCEIDHPVYGWIPFTADPDDVEPLGAKVFKAARATAAAYVAPVPDPAIAREQERAEARAYLAATDWMVVRAVETGELLDEDIRQKRAAARITASVAE